MTRLIRIRLTRMLLSAIAVGCAWGHPPSVCQAYQTELEPRRYRCTQASGALTIDGRLDESAWRQADWTDLFVDIEGPAQKPRPPFQTRAKMLWDDKYLYIAAALEEPHVWGTLDKHDQIVFHDNDFEVFIDPDGDARNYYEIEVNALNTIFDLLLVRTYVDGGPALHDWSLEGLQSAVHISGTLNDASDADRGWSVEFALPWAALAEHAHRPAPPNNGDVWRMNFSRVEWQHRIVRGRYEKVPDTPENNWVWSPQGEINMHIPQRWGYVEFAGPDDPDDTQASADVSRSGTPQSAPSTSEPAPTAGETGPVARLRYEILDEGGRPISGRLTFIRPNSEDPDLFPNARAAPTELAVRKNIIYTKSGRGIVTVPPGPYTVYASRGPEWSVARNDVHLRADEESKYTAKLRREVDTSGWICGDFHLHTLTHSGHGDANMLERVITFLGEGLEFAVATDHNHHTDYQPTIETLGVGTALTAITGNEVSTPIGHFNAFPLDPGRPVPPPDSRDAIKLFKLIRNEPNRFGIVPVIQVNHPRWGRIDYFGNADLDPVTGVAHATLHSDDFDSVEVFNENEGWGYYDAEVPGGPETGSGRHSVLRDWFNLLNRGYRYAAVGNSDSHTVHGTLAGYPRNYVRSSTDEPDKMDVAEVAGAIRSRQVFTTIGPFVEYSVNGEVMGAQATAPSGRVELRVKVQAASWVDCDRVKIVVNGDVVGEIPVPDTRQVLRLDTVSDVAVRRDSWMTLLIEGDDPLSPVVHDQHRPIRPLAVMNPVWIDADGDGRWSSPWEQARSLVATTESPELVAAALADRLPSERGLVVLAAAEAAHPAAADLVRRGLADDERVVRLLTARAAETLADSALLDPLLRSCEQSGQDPYLQVALLRACSTCAPARFQAVAFAFLDRNGAEVSQRYGEELMGRVPAQPVREWQAVGYFANPERNSLTTTIYEPEATASEASFTAKSGVPVSWRMLRASAEGYLDLKRLSREVSQANDAIAYAQTWVHSPDERSARFALGTDDGCRMWANHELVYEDTSRHAAKPFSHVGKLPLRRGWNRVLLKVENGVGDFGVYLRFFDDELTARATPVKIPDPGGEPQ